MSNCRAIELIVVVICSLTAGISLITGAVSGSLFWLLLASGLLAFATIIQLIWNFTYGRRRTKEQNGEDD